MAQQTAPFPLEDILRTPPVRPSLGTEAVDKLLQAIRDHLGMDVAFVSEFRKHDRIFRHVDARDHTPIRPGDTALLEQGYCQRVVDGRLPGLIPDTRRVPGAMALPETHAIPIGAHLSVPIRLADGRVFGTFCCFSYAADRSLGERDYKMMQVFAALLADQIDRDVDGQRALETRRTEITTLLEAGQPDIVYQPICDLEDGRLAGVECLARFNRQPHRSPDKWFAAASEVGLAVELELAAVRNAVRALRELPPGAYLAVNCSPQTILSRRMHSLLQPLDLRRMVLEVTEHDDIEDYGSFLAVLASLRARGLRVAIDDAGAGYASLRHVLHIQPDLIKLDMSLTRGIDADAQRRALATALIAFGRETGARIVAEGVETQSELRALKKLGAGYVQGYYVSKPVSLREALACRLPRTGMSRAGLQRCGTLDANVPMRRLVSTGSAPIRSGA